MERIESVSTPKTLRTFKTSDGKELVLKGTENPIQATEEGGLIRYEKNHLKLYQKIQKDGLDTFELVGKKSEKYTYDFKKNTKALTSIEKETYNPNTGALTERSKIALNVGGGKTIECNGDVFKMSGNIATNRANNTPEVTLNFAKGKLSPMAKRILNILKK